MKKQHLLRLFVGVLPLIAPVAAQAAPYDYPDTNTRRDNRAYNDNNTRQQRERVTGIVNLMRGNREFDLRLRGGDIVRVKSDSYLNLRRGDLVRIRGDFRGQTLYAEVVTRLDDNVYNNTSRTQRVDFRGEVIEVEGTSSLRVRAENGRVYSVRTEGYLDDNISRGDLVHVQGLFDGSFVRADNDDVDQIRDGAYPYGSGYTSNDGFGNDYGRRVNFPGTIRQVLSSEVQVRGDNGRTYIVRVSNSLSRSLRNGDRVQVQGITRGTYIVATDIERLR